MKRESMVFYQGWLEAVENLPMAERGEILTAIVTYGIKGEILKELSPVAKAMFSMAKPQIDANNKKYANGCKGGNSGKKGGRPRVENEEFSEEEKPQENPLGVISENPKTEPRKPHTVTKEKPLKNPLGVIDETPTRFQNENPKQTPNDNDNVNDNVNDNDIVKEILSDESTKKKFSLPTPSERFDYEGVKEYYNYRFQGKLNGIQKMTDTRKQAVKARVAQYGKESIRIVFDKVLQSSFLLGSNDRNWQADFDWIFKQANYTKILEGKYDEKPTTASSSKAERRASVSRLKDLAGQILSQSASEED